MTQEVKALLVFCEGPHDVAFVRLVMKNVFGFKKKEWKFSEFPAPLNQLFRTSVEAHAARDLSLDMAHKFFLPDKVMTKDGHVLLIFNSGGKQNTDNVKAFLANFLTLLDQADVFLEDAATLITQVCYLFLYDADHQGVSKTLDDMRDKFTEIDELPWIDQWIPDKDNPFAACAEDKGIYIWGETPKGGTLEDILLPMFQKSQPDSVNKAAGAVDDIFKWEIDSAIFKTAVAETAKRKKSIITLAGQYEKPGGSMNVILDQAKLITKESFANDDKVISFATFIRNFFGL